MSKFYHFTVEVGPEAETFESYMKKVFARIGLTGDSSIKAYDKFTGQSFFRYMINDAKSNPAVAEAIKNFKGKIVKITVRVFPNVVNNLRRFGINLSVNDKGKAAFTGYSSKFSTNVRKYQNFTEAPSTPIGEWTNAQRLDAVIKRAALLLPESVGRELLALLDLQVLAVAVGVVVVWAALHFVGVGEIIDVVLLIVGFVSIGPVAWRAGEYLISFAIGTTKAKKEEDLDEAAKHLSEAVAMLGVQVVMALLLKKAPKVLNEARNSLKSSATPLTIKTVGEPPITKGKWFYKPPEIKINKHQYAAKEVPGSTDIWGNSSVYPGRNSKLKDIELAKFHEEFHQLLTPKLQTFKWLRKGRAVLKTNSYLKSYLLRYLEEALAEATAQVRIKGFNWKNIWEGIKFPVGKEMGEAGYVTLAKMGTEANGVLLGPINVNGMIFNAYYSFSEDW